MEQTVKDFGDQWTRFQENPGYYGSLDIFQDIVEPLLPVGEFKGGHIVEIGSGSGRIVNMLVEAGAAHIYALEPSAAMEVLKKNTQQHVDRITYLELTGDALPDQPKVDIVVSIGVIHHIPKPEPVIAQAYKKLKQDGRILVWLYGREGNELYLSIAEPLRRITTKLPDFILSFFSHVLTMLLLCYISMCRLIPLPMHKYMLGVLGKYTYRPLWLTVFDQLNPSYAKYYTQAEAEALLATAGFVDVRSYHRHGYSWAVYGRKATA